MKNDDAYANAAYIPDATAIRDAWAREALDYRMVEGAVGQAKLGVKYGDHPRQAFDLFMPSGTPKGLLVFVHGGFWRMLDRDDWSHFAEGAAGQGWAVAVPGYILTPAVSIAQITSMIGAAITQAADMVDGPIVLTGHSAGGHLVARMVMKDGPLGAEVSARLQKVVPISPLSDLRPLIQTSMNADFKLTPDTATAESPALHAKGTDTPVHVWVGAEERPAFLDQAQWLADAWKSPLTIEEDRHHFDIIDGLRDPNHKLLKTLLD